MNKITSLIASFIVSINLLATSVYADGGKKFRLFSEPADFIRFNIDPAKIEIRENGRRTPQDDDHFEWWYFDFSLDDGRVASVTMGDNFPMGSERRFVRLDLSQAGPSGKTMSVLHKLRRAGQFDRGQANVRIGNHWLTGDLETYRLHVEPGGSSGLGCDLTLVRNVPSYRAGTGLMGVGRAYFGWLNAVPRGIVRGTITMNGKTENVTGVGYHDHKWGNAAFEDYIADWWWGRADFESRAIVAATVNPKPKYGTEPVSLLYVGNETTIETNLTSKDLVVDFGNPMSHPDSRHASSIADFVRFRLSSGDELNFPTRNQKLILSLNVLDYVSPLKRFFAELFGMTPWYSRFETQPIIQFGGQSTVGKGIVEYFDFE